MFFEILEYNKWTLVENLWATVLSSAPVLSSISTDNFLKFLNKRIDEYMYFLQELKI